MTEQFDVIVIGADSAGEALAGVLRRRGLHLALVERQLIGREGLQLGLRAQQPGQAG